MGGRKIFYLIPWCKSYQLERIFNLLSSGFPLFLNENELWFGPHFSQHKFITERFFWTNVFTASEELLFIHSYAVCGLVGILVPVIQVLLIMPSYWFPVQAQYAEAIKCYNKCVSLKPDQVACYTNRALCHLKLNQVGFLWKTFIHLLGDCFSCYFLSEYDNYPQLFFYGKNSCKTWHKFIHITFKVCC